VARNLLSGLEGELLADVLSQASGEVGVGLPVKAVHLTEGEDWKGGRVRLQRKQGDPALEGNGNAGARASIENGEARRGGKGRRVSRDERAGNNIHSGLTARIEHTAQIARARRMPQAPGSSLNGSRTRWPRALLGCGRACQFPLI
jgi:hypothetical protein